MEILWTGSEISEPAPDDSVSNRKIEGFALALPWWSAGVSPAGDEFQGR
jgi:hypothetical protein